MNKIAELVKRISTSEHTVSYSYMLTPTKSNMDNTTLDSFMNKIFSDLGGTYVTLLCAIGDRLSLFKDNVV